MGNDPQAGIPLTKKQVLERLRRKEGLAHQDMRGLDLSGICFDGFDVSHAKMAETDLCRASFRGADLTNASLWHANLRDASFDEAVLDDADFDMANLDGATFHNAKIRRTLFPLHHLPLDRIQESIRTGRRVVMDKGDPEQM